ncbi:2-deoxystreptamine glucosyltransferase [Salinivirga cyanobacteriivorans]|uniref:2-deoxystreptamine glucosyltransferase n=1 Tax=Salinivirga cyanobacteriivorans TaxID=1307839 RepID=A0A0S2HZV1_9BACT|nr:glycosyltransferase [Salinivirga cyanobacteriivorans]ALO15599.1 2-deoxystreptamine glucosyltransferase [Salinivirga cyanobacteriivorans]
MKILILLNSDLFHDARIIRQANAAAETGEVFIYYVADKQKTPKALNPAIKLHNIPYPGNIRQKIKKHTCIHREYDFMAQYIQKQRMKCDKIIANDLPTLRTAIQLKKRGYCKGVIYDAHEIYTETIKQFFPGKGTMSGVKRIVVSLLTNIMVFCGRRYERKAVKKVDEMLTVNESLAEFFAQKYKIKKPTVVRSIPATPDRKEQSVDLKKRFQWPHNSVILLYQGVLNPGRGIRISMEALTQLPDHYKMVIIGDGPLKSSFETLAEAKHLTARIKFIGQIPNNLLAGYTQGADIGLCLMEPINLSKKLSLPNKIFEYIHAGIPVLGSDLPEIKQIISSFGCGEVATFDVNCLVAQIIKIQENSYRDGIQEAQKTLSWENEKQKLLNILNH